MTVTQSATGPETETRTKLFIGGEERAPASAGYYQLHNPARPDELVGEAANGSPEDIDAACKAAQEAFPAWAALSYAERADYLRKVADYLVADKEDLDFRINLDDRNDPARRSLPALCRNGGTARQRR
jgi:acyl-CoA reductase-like NAD-dependent aldehyde dehydrogenase